MNYILILNRCTLHIVGKIFEQITWQRFTG